MRARSRACASSRMVGESAERSSLPGALAERISVAPNVQGQLLEGASVSVELMEVAATSEIKKPYSASWIAFCFGIAVIQYLAVKLGLVVGIAHGNVSAVWPATGFAIAVLLRYGTNLWPGVAVGSFLGLVQTAVGPSVAAGEALAALLEAITAVWLVRRFVGTHEPFFRTRDVIRFCLLAAGVSTAVSATVGVGSLFLGGLVPLKSLGYLWGTWWLGDLMGALIVAPFLIIWTCPAAWSFDRTVWTKTGVVFGLLILAGIFAFWGSFFNSAGVTAYPVAFLTLPLVVTATFLAGPRGATAACVICSALAISGTAQGWGPFIRGSVNESLWLLQSYLCVVAVTATILAGVLKERDRALEEVQRSRETLDSRIAERTQELSDANTQLKREVAVRRKAESALQESEAKYRFLTEHAHDILWTVDLNMRPTYVSPSVEKVLGFTPEERMHQDPEVQLTANSLTEARQKLGEELQREKEQGHRFDHTVVVEQDYWHKDGSLVCLESVMKFIRDQSGAPVGVHGLSRDITERKKAQAALQKSEEFNRRLVEHAPFGIIYVAGDGTVEYANPAAHRIAGISEGRKSAILGQKVYELGGLQNRSEIEKIFHRLLAGESISDFEVPYHSTAGRETILLVAATPRLGCNGTTTGVTLMFTDIAERKRAEELQRQTGRLRALADLAGGVAHNFNNLLQIVIGHLELALMDLEAGDYALVKEGIEKVLMRSRFGAEVVGRLQRFAQPPDHLRARETEVFDLSLLAGQAVEVSQALMTAREEAGTRISLHMQLQEGCFVNADKNEIFTVVVQLVRNAVEALPEGGDIDLSTSLEGAMVALQVKDSGIGISQENLERIFNPFFTTKAEPGAGLSLASGQNIVVESGGKVCVDSTEGEGTTFKVLFPLAENRPEPPKASPEPPTEQRLNTLAIDDMEGITDFLKTALSKYGHAILTARSGEEGIEIFMEKIPDLVICDLAMPGMNGWEVGERIRAICRDRGIPKPPFILLTAWAGQEIEKEKIARSGVDAVVAKPLNVSNMVRVIGEVVEKSRSKDSKP